MKKKKLLLIQLNEINFELIKKYSKNINFNFFNKDFLKKISITDSEKNYELLEPWIQWVSVYTGKTAEQHKIFRLGDVEKYNGKSFFNTIENLKKSVGVVCSMNLKNTLNKPKYFFSDPWTNTSSGPSKTIKFITKTISKVVNLNSHKSMPIALYFKIFVILLISFRIKNIFLYLKLIINFKKKWNKALLLDLMLHDLHLGLLNKHRTDFSAIFLNAGAHIQHHYFFNSSQYINKDINNPEWYIERKYDPVLEMIIFYDQILSEYKKLNDYEIVLATGLSQVPYDRIKYYYRFKDHSNFLKNLNINFDKVVPRMTRDFLVSFKNNVEKTQAIDKLNQINEINKEKIFSFEIRNDSIFVTLCIQKEIGDKDTIKIDNNNKILIKDHVVFVALKNGMHDKKGYFYSSFNSDIKNITEINKEVINFFNK